MNEYVEDQLNVASKNLASFFYEKIGKQYLEDICSMKGWSDNNAILNFFLRTRPYCSAHQISYLSDPLHIFCN